MCMSRRSAIGAGDISLENSNTYETAMAEIEVNLSLTAERDASNVRCIPMESKHLYNPASLGTTCLDQRTNFDMSNTYENMH